MNGIHHLTSNATPLFSHNSNSVNNAINRCISTNETLMTNSCPNFTSIEIPEDIQSDFDGIKSFDYFYSSRYLSYSDELGHNDEKCDEQNQHIDLSSVNESDVIASLSELDEQSCSEKIKAFICSQNGALTIAGIVVIAGLSYLVLRLKDDDMTKVSRRSAPKPSATSENITTTSIEPSVTSESIPTTTLKTIKNLDYASTLAAVEECDTNSSAELEVLITLNKANCIDTVLNEIFNPSVKATNSGVSGVSSSCPRSNVIWQSANTKEPSVMVKTSCEQFKAILGASVTKSEYIDSVRTERLKMPSVQTSIKKSLENSPQNKLNAKLQSFDKPNEICVSLDEGGIDIANIGGGVGMQIRQVECRPKFDASNQHIHPVAPEDKPIAEAAKASCVRRVALISDGISNQQQAVSASYQFDSNISPISQNTGTSQTHQTCSNAADKLVSSMLRRCPNLDIIDVQATTNIQPSSNQGQCISVLSGNNLVQSLDALSKYEVVNPLHETNNTTTPSGFDGGNNSSDSNTSKLDAVIIFEPAEVGGYTGDVTLTQETVDALESQGIPVYAYESSQGAWLRSVPNIKHTSSVTEMVAKPTLIPVDLPYQRAYEATATVTTATGLTGVGLSAMYCLYKNRNKATAQQASMGREAIPLEAVGGEEDYDHHECEDCVVTTTHHQDGSVSTRKIFVIPGSQNLLDITKTVSKTGTIKQKMSLDFKNTGKKYHVESEHSSRGAFNLKEFGYKEGKQPVCHTSSGRYQIEPSKHDTNEPSTSSERRPFLNAPKKNV